MCCILELQSDFQLTDRPCRSPGQLARPPGALLRQSAFGEKPTQWEVVLLAVEASRMVPKTIPWCRRQASDVQSDENHR
jgi:hypothetical protein